MSTDTSTTSPSERLRYSAQPDAIIEPGLDMLRHPSRSGDRYTTPEVLL